MDAYCRSCGEPWNVTGGLNYTHTDMAFHEFANFYHGAGCPCCQGGARDDIPEAERHEKWMLSLMAADDMCIGLGHPEIWDEKKAWPWGPIDGYTIVERLIAQGSVDMAQLRGSTDVVFYWNEYNEDQKRKWQPATLYASFTLPGIFDSGIKSRVNEAALDRLFGDIPVIYEHCDVYVPIARVVTLGGFVLNKAAITACLNLALELKGEDWETHGVLNYCAYAAEVEDHHEKCRHEAITELQEEVAEFLGISDVPDIDDLVEQVNCSDEDPEFGLVSGWENRVTHYIIPTGWQFYRCIYSDVPPVYAALPAGKLLEDTMGAECEMLTCREEKIVGWETMPVAEFQCVRADDFTWSSYRPFNTIGWRSLPPAARTAYMAYFRTAHE